jgi:hypothetical protein
VLDRQPESGPADSKPLEPPRDPFFNPFRVAKNDNVKSIIADVLTEIQNYESHFKLRRRARKAVDRARFERIVSGVICDLIHCNLHDANEALAISLSKAVLGRSGRY